MLINMVLLSLEQSMVALLGPINIYSNDTKVKKSIVGLKLDFEKTFDKTKHGMILAILRRRSFGDKWCSWISQIHSPATSAVLLNNVPGKNLKSRKGVRQGDPLSPLLFVLATGFLQTILNNAMNRDCIHPPQVQLLP